MNKRNLWLLTISVMVSSIFSGNALAFSFGSASATAYLYASSIPKTLGDITSGASGGASVKANGLPTSEYQDTVRISSVTVSPAISDREFTVQVGINNSWTNASSSNGRCVYYTTSCNISQNESKNEPTVPVSVKLKRNSTNAYTPIPDGTLIATVKLTQYSRFATGGGPSATLYFYTFGEVTPIIPTCEVKNFDNKVTLPDVRRADLVSHGTGRYAGATKEFTINLACKYQPKVNVTFDGDKMPGIASEDVLVNKLTGNDNVGVQILYGSNPLKIGAKVALLSAARASESLKFKAYYYYKGGTVQSGPVKSQTVFTFDYK